MRTFRDPVDPHNTGPVEPGWVELAQGERIRDGDAFYDHIIGKWYLSRLCDGSEGKRPPYPVVGPLVRYARKVKP